MASSSYGETDLDLASNRFVDIGRNVIHFWDLIRKHVQCSDLLFLPGMPDSDKSQEILELDRSGQHEEAADKFLTAMETLEDPGKWESFLQALKDKGYEYISEVIEGTLSPDPENSQACKTLITEVFGETIKERVHIMELMHSLISEELIDDRGKEKLQAREAQGGNWEAMMLLLLSLIWRKKKNWFESFLKVLIKNDYEDVARLLDETKCDKVKNKLQQEENEELTSSRENVLYGEGAALQSSPNYSAPSVSGEEGGAPGLLAEAAEDERTRPKEVEVEGTAPEEPVPPDDVTVAKQLASREDTAGSEQFKRPIQESSDAGPTSAAFGPGDSASANTVDVNRSTDYKPSLQEKLNNLSVDSDEDNTRDADSLLSGDDSMEAAPAEAEGTEVELRGYQKELAKSALEGRNVIICAPTGSGKTIVALKIIEEHLQGGRSQGVRKVAFLVDQVALAEQQYKQCLKYLPKHTRVKKICGDSMKNSPVPFNSLLERVDLLVMTAQILVDALRSSTIRGVQDFSLLVFDECHHTNARHPYNQIMAKYLDQLKLADPPKPELLPQVVGLTASVGVGKAKDKEKAKDHILRLCANLDAEKVETVRDCRQELAEQSSVPVLDVQTVEGRKDDKFRALVGKIMDSIETEMKNSPHLAQAPRVVNALQNLPSSRGTDQYIQWLSGMRRPVAQTDAQDPKRYYRACITHLEIYNTALSINNDCRTKDAIEHLNREFEDIRLRSSMGSTQEEKDLLRRFDERQAELRQSDQNSTNPKLEKLKGMILKAFTDEPESRAIVFAKTRDLVKALVRWMNDDDQLNRLRPAPFTGAQASTEKGGMTRHKQVDVLEYFKEGNHKVIVATSVAEEGLDIRKCNLVVRYLHVTNEIAMMQARGRARAEDSKFAVVAAADSGMAEKEELNLMREMLMKRALDELHEEEEKHPQVIKEKIRKYQEEAKVDRELEALTRRGRDQNDDEYELLCLHCDKFACMSTDIRKIQASHHVVIAEDFRESVRELPHPRPIEYGDFRKVGKIACRNCGYDWGILAIYRNGKFPVIKIESFVYRDVGGLRDTRKKWKMVPFAVQQLSNDDLKEIVARTRLT